MRILKRIVHLIETFKLIFFYINIKTLIITLFGNLLLQINISNFNYANLIRIKY
jgi:hypothetical protein